MSPLCNRRIQDSASSEMMIRDRAQQSYGHVCIEYADAYED
jgi:hypothetical protein